MISKNLLKIVIVISISSLLSGCMATIFSGVATSTVELAKDRSVGETINDNKIAMMIKADLMKKGFSKLYAKIKVDVVQSRVILTGCVSSEADSMTAVESSWNQNGVVEVINELKIDKNSDNFNLFQYTRDAMITGQIKSKTLIDSSVKFSNYTVITSNDVVYLFGIGRSEEELNRVADIASNTRGVKKVISHVKIQENHNKTNYQYNTKTNTNKKQNVKNTEKSDADFLIDEGISGNDKHW